MSQENVDVVRAFVDAIARRDEAAGRKLLAPDPEWHLLPTGVAVADARGLEDVLKTGHEFFSAWEHAELVQPEVMDAGESVVVGFRWRLRGRSSGLETQVEYFGVYRLREGKIVRYQEYETRAEALEAAGLRE